MKNITNKEKLINLIEKSMKIENLKSYEETKINTILNFFKENKLSIPKYNENCIGKGTYSTVYKINKSYVLKIGLAKSNTNIQKSENIAQDLIRQNIKFITGQYIVIVGIEIQQYAKKYTANKEEDLHNIKQALYEENLIWEDAKYSNMGILNNKIVVIDIDDIFPKKSKS